MTQCRPNFSSETNGFISGSRIISYTEEFMVNSMTAGCLGPMASKQVQINSPPPPCLTIGVKLVSVWAGWGSYFWFLFLLSSMTKCTCEEVCLPQLCLTSIIRREYLRSSPSGSSSSDRHCVYDLISMLQVVPLSSFGFPFILLFPDSQNHVQTLRKTVNLNPPGLTHLAFLLTCLPALSCSSPCPLFATLFLSYYSVTPKCYLFFLCLI